MYTGLTEFSWNPRQMKILSKDNISFAKNCAANREQNDTL